MTKWLIVLAALLLSACSGSLPEKTYYQLPLPQPPLTATQAPLSQPPAQTAPPHTSQHLIWLAQIQVADFLAGSGLVYQTSELNYSLANNNLWASPLEQQLANSLVNSLNSLLPGWTVSITPMRDSQAILNLVITGFHGRYDGKVVLSGEWLLNYRQQIIKQPFYLTVTQQQDGYAAMVQALAQAWQQETQAIADQLRKLP